MKHNIKFYIDLADNCKNNKVSLEAARKALGTEFTAWYTNYYQPIVQADKLYKNLQYALTAYNKIYRQYGTVKASISSDEDDLEQINDRLKKLNKRKAEFKESLNRVVAVVERILKDIETEYTEKHGTFSRTPDEWKKAFAETGWTAFLNKYATGQDKTPSLLTERRILNEKLQQTLAKENALKQQLAEKYDSLKLLKKDLTDAQIQVSDAQKEIEELELATLLGIL